MKIQSTSHCREAENEQLGGCRPLGEALFWGAVFLGLTLAAFGLGEGGSGFSDLLQPQQPQTSPKDASAAVSSDTHVNTAGRDPLPRSSTAETTVAATAPPSSTNAEPASPSSNAAKLFKTASFSHQRAPLNVDDLMKSVVLAPRRSTQDPFALLKTVRLTPPPYRLDVARLFKPMHLGFPCRRTDVARLTKTVQLTSTPGRLDPTRLVKRVRLNSASAAAIREVLVPVKETPRSRLAVPGLVKTAKLAEPATHWDYARLFKPLTVVSPPIHLDMGRLMKWSRLEPAYWRLDVEKQTRQVRLIPLPPELVAPTPLDKTIQRIAGPLSNEPKPPLLAPKVEPARVTLRETPTSYRLGKMLLLVARVVAADQQALGDQPVEWTIDRSGVGQFVALPQDARQTKPGEKLLPTFARTYTAKNAHRVETAVGAVDVKPGETWCVVDAASAGTMLATAQIPTLAGSVAGKATARLHWDHAEIVFPPSIQVQAGAETFPFSRVALATGEPLPHYRVRYTLTEPNGAGLSVDGVVQEVESASDGRAVLALHQLAPKVGQTRGTAELLGPNPLSGEPAVVLAKGPFLVSWIAPRPTLVPTGPSVAAVGDWVKLEVRGSVVDSAFAKDLRLETIAPNDWSIRVAGRDAHSDLGEWPPPAGSATEVFVRSDHAGVGSVRFEIRSRGHVWTTAETSLRFAVPTLGFAVQPSSNWRAGVAGTLAVTVQNKSEIAAPSVRVRQEIPVGVRVLDAAQGIADAAGVSWDFPRLEPGAKRTFRCSLIPTTSGDLSFRSIASAAFAASVVTQTDVVVLGVPALRLSLRDLIDPVEVNGFVEYEVLLENLGTGTARGATMEASTPTELELQEVAGSLPSVLKNGNLTLGPIAALAPGAQLSCRVKARAIKSGEARFVIRVHHPSAGVAGIEEQESTVIYKP